MVTKKHAHHFVLNQLGAGPCNYPRCRVFHPAPPVPNFSEWAHDGGYNVNLNAMRGTNTRDISDAQRVIHGPNFQPISKGYY